MAFGKIPRFSPSFSPAEAVTAFRYLSQNGPNDSVVRKFEKDFASYIGAQHAVMVPSARYGFYLLLRAFGIQEEDEVVIPGLTYFAIPAMVPLLGAKPVFADIGLSSHVLDPEAFRASITEKTKAVVPTHLFGTPCNMEAICEIAREHGIKVIEDCAQSTGASFQGKKVGSWGDAAYYTFGLTKNITTLSGAMVTTDDPDVAAFIRKEVEDGGYSSRRKMAKEALVGLAMFVATHPAIYWASVHPAVVLGNKLGKDPIHERFGESERTYEEIPSYYKAQGKPLAVQAAVGMKQLSRIEELNGARRKNGQSLDVHLSGTQNLLLPTYPEGAEPIYMSFVVHHENRFQLCEALRKRGVDTTVGYMNDMSDHPLFQEYKRTCPNATKANQELLHIPVHPNLSEADVDHLIQAVKEACIEVS
ncbi:MAG: aminotransferase class I/II-fold pyridoxal phosphate-dependent enzyme [Myxococcota bacterium]|nr:aminotransferase class I/II-fold pyridoxal phosphate-dependent enzyme [Myxococcota bacterium]